MRLLLVGMMGAGKTTVGRELSARTGWPYLDFAPDVAELRMLGSRGRMFELQATAAQPQFTRTGTFAARRHQASSPFPS
jgi:adenylate kinase family enzyme